MTSHYLIHVTKELDRWDLLAYKYYGDAYRFEPIIQANPTIPISPVLPSGKVLYIPILEHQSEEELRPLWNR